MKIRNFVHKYSEKFNKPVVHEDKRRYIRANRRREVKWAVQECLEEKNLTNQQEKDDGKV